MESYKIKKNWSDKNPIVLSVLFGTALSASLAFLLYDSVWGMLLLPAIIYFSYRFMAMNQKKKADLEKTRDFCNAITTVSGALAAGYSMENAWREAAKELYSENPDGFISLELREICYGMDNNIPLENLIADFAEQTGIEDIQVFAEVFSYAKRSGGDMIGILEKVATQIREKQEILQEIDVIIAEKKLEQNIMNLVPLGMLFYLRFTAREYISLLYHNWIGITVMTASFILYGLAFLISQRILRIEVWKSNK